MRARPAPGGGRTPDRSTGSAARSLGVIGLLSSALVVASTFGPGLAAAVESVRLVALAGAVVSAVLLLPVWRRMSPRATLALVPVGLAGIACHNAVAPDDPYRYGVFYLLLFVWIGAHHPRWTSLAAAPLALVAYTAPLVLHHEPGAAWTALYAVPIFVTVGEVIAFRSQALVRASAELRRLAHTDPLTGLLDRRAFVAGAEQMAAAGETDLLVAYLDLDGFKPVNDTLGHAAGDALLQRIAVWLVSELRTGDLAGRLGGDEFAVLVRAATPEDEPAVVARLQRAVAEASPPELPVGVSVGLARLADHPDVESALTAADTGMYAAKRARKERRSAPPASVEERV